MRIYDLVKRILGRADKNAQQRAIMRTRKPTFENLGERRMLAGVITGNQLGGDLAIYGDGSPNGIQLSQTGPSSFLLAGRPTGIPGDPGTAVVGATIFNNVTTVRVEGQRGADEVAIFGFVPALGMNGPLQRVTVIGGPGADKVTIQNVYSPGTITVIGGDNDDSINLFNSYALAIVIDGGDGNDNVQMTLPAQRVDTLNIDTGAGRDAVTVTGTGELSIVRRADIDLGTDDDSAAFRNIKVRRLYAVGGTGQNTLILDRLYGNERIEAIGFRLRVN